MGDEFTENSGVRLMVKEDYFKVFLRIILTLMFSDNLGLIYLFNNSTDTY